MSKRQNLGRGPVGKTAVVGAKDRATNRVKARVIKHTDGPTLHRFVRASAEDGAKLYTDDAAAYKGLENHETVKHSVSEYVNGMAHTNGIESFWSMLKRGYHGVYHQMSEKHPTALRQRVRRAAQHAGDGHHRPDAPRCRRDGRQAAHVPGPGLGCRRRRNRRLVTHSTRARAPRTWRERCFCLSRTKARNGPRLTEPFLKST